MPEIYGSWEEIQKEKYEKIIKILPDIRKSKILDIGIGNGYFENFLKEKNINFNIIGIDNEMRMIEKNNILADGNIMPFRDKSFDGVICIDTIHHIKNRDFIRVLKPDGFMLVAVFFNDFNLNERENIMNDLKSHFRKEERIIHKGKENEIISLFSCLY